MEASYCLSRKKGDLILSLKEKWRRLTNFLGRKEAPRCTYRENRRHPVPIRRRGPHIKYVWSEEDSFFPNKVKRGITVFLSVGRREA